jgi:hypothetical protein
VSDAFISHSSANPTSALHIESGLETRGLSVWLDDSEIRFGVLSARSSSDPSGRPASSSCSVHGCSRVALGRHRVAHRFKGPG